MGFNQWEKIFNQIYAPSNSNRKNSIGIIKEELHKQNNSVFKGWANNKYRVDYKFNTIFTRSNYQINLTTKLLYIAAYHGYLDIVKYFISKRHLTTKSKDNCGNIPLHMATLNGCLDIVKYFIDKKKIALDVKNNDVNNSLYIADKNVLSEITEPCVIKKNNYEDTSLDKKNVLQEQEKSNALRKIKGSIGVSMNNNDQGNKKIPTKVIQSKEGYNKAEAKSAEKEKKISEQNDQVTELTDTRDNLEKTKPQLGEKNRELDDTKRNVLQLTDDLRQEQFSQKGKIGNSTREKDLGLNNENKRISTVSIQSRKQVIYASIPFVLSGACAVGASLTIPYLAVCITLAIAALSSLVAGLYCSYKANTALKNVEIHQVLKDPECVVSQNSV